MRKTRLLCLAVSRRESGNCIAGIDIDSKAWIRPIHSRTRAAFADAELVIFDPAAQKQRFMAPLDLIAIDLEEYAGVNSQPENWIVASPSAGNAFAVLQRCESQKSAKFLLAHADRAGPLLHSTGDSLPASAFESAPLSHSLSLVVPRDLSWRVSANPKYPGKLQVRACFHFEQFEYSLVVTDPVWEARCHGLGLGTHPDSQLCRPGEIAFLTVSLAAIQFHGLHYKLVAGVIHLPR